MKSSIFSNIMPHSVVKANSNINSHWTIQWHTQEGKTLYPQICHMEVKLRFSLPFVSPVSDLDTCGDTSSQEHYVLPYGMCKRDYVLLLIFFQSQNYKQNILVVPFLRRKGVSDFKYKMWWWMEVTKMRTWLYIFRRTSLGPYNNTVPYF
jgi:hypothetical protein